MGRDHILSSLLLFFNLRLRFGSKLFFIQKE